MRVPRLWNSLTYSRLFATLHPQGGQYFWGNKIKDFSRTFKHPIDLFKTYSTAVVSTWYSFYGIKSVSNTDAQYIAHSSPMTASFFGIQALRGPLKIKFENFQSPNPFKGLSRALKNGKNFQEHSQTFKKEWSPWFYPMATHVMHAKSKITKYNSNARQKCTI